jgi:putative endonuclease
MFYTYLVQNSVNKKIYIGQTDNIEKRVNQHNDTSFKKSSYTKLNKGQGTWELVYTEEYVTRKEAEIREAQLKTSRGRDFIKKTILGR